MKSLRITILGALLLIGYTSVAQQIPLYGQYYFNRFLYNPALTGENERTEAYLLGRRQWTALEGYQTRAVTVSGSPQGTNVGLGLYYVNDVNNLAKSNSVYGNYAYKIQLDNDSKLILGFNIGVLDYSFNMQNIVLADMNDAAVNLLRHESGPVVDAGVGVAYKNKGFMLGASFPQLFNGPIIYKDNFINSIDHNLENHYNLMASYDIKIGENAKLQPMVMYKGARNAPGQIDANLVLDFMDKAWLGLAYRDDYAMTALAGVTISNLVRIGYSYDWSIGGYSTALGGSHELSFGFIMKDKDKGESEDEKARRIAEQEFTIDSMLMDRDDRIDKLEQTITDLERAPNRVDTVVIVKKIVSTVPAPSGGSTGGTPGGTTGSGSSGTTGSTGTTGPSSSSASGNFMVVAGSFTKETNAKNYSSRLHRQGYSPTVYYDRGRRVYYVHVGRFNNKEVARQKARATGTSSLKLWVKTLN